MVAAFTQDQGVCEGSESGRDMDGATTGKVETGKIEKPAVRIPCPIGDGAVDESTPPETKDNGGHDTTAFKAAAHHDHCCTGR